MLVRNSQTLISLIKSIHYEEDNSAGGGGGIYLQFNQIL